MSRYVHVLLLLLLTLSTLEQIKAGKSSFRGSSGGHHGYPSGGGLSGGGHSGSHGSLSGGGSSHGYPSSSGGLSGGGKGYPSTGGSSGSHSYPSSGGISGGSSGSHSYPSSGGISGGGSGGKGYPATGGSSGSHSYPSSGGISGGGASKYPATNTHTTTTHVHYHYTPPQQIRYTPVGGAPVSYPVYHGAPPTYVYQYRDSGSVYGSLLAGLALYNLGSLAGKSHTNTYKPQPGEICKFAVKKNNGDYQETKIGCELITSFIFEEQAKNPTSSNNNSTITTVTVTNVTTVTNGQPNNAQLPPAPGNVNYTMLSNGALVPVNNTSPNVTAPMNNTVTSSVTVTTTTTNSTVVNALDVKGKEIEVTPNTQCFVIRITSTSNMRKSVPCGLLQSYAAQSLKPNSGNRHAPAFTMAAIILVALAIN